MRSTGLVLAAGGIAAVNEVVFAPLAGQKAATLPGANPGGALGVAVEGFNWRLIPATAILAVTLGGLEKLAPDFAVGLAGLVVLSVLIIPFGSAASPIDNAVSALGF